MQTAKEKSRFLRRRLTPVESIFWEVVRNRRLKGLRFRRQFPLYVRENDALKVLIADFCCTEHRLIVELDGSSHDDRMEYDSIRDNVIEQLGFRILRVPNDAVINDLPGVLETIARLAEDNAAVIPPLHDDGEGVRG